MFAISRQFRVSRPHADDIKRMEENMRTCTSAIVAALIMVAGSKGFAAANDYRFELAGTPQKTGNGASIVRVRLIHVPEKKVVSGAIVIESKADMSPIGMPTMGAPAKPLSEQPPGTYRFEIQNGSVWKKPDNWALTLAAKVQGEPETLRGTVVVKLEP
jgi:hypothetical protein